MPDITNVEEAKTSVHTTMKQTLMPDTKNIGEKITSDTKIIKQTIIIVISNAEEIIAQDITNIKQTILLNSIKVQNFISGTTNIKITILPETTINKPTTTNKEIVTLKKKLEYLGSNHFIPYDIMPDIIYIEKIIPGTANNKPSTLN